jgi:hypothetical protein
MLDRFTKSTRTTTGQMVCSGADDAAEHRRLMKQEKEDKAPRDNKGLGNIVARKLDVSARLFQAEYPRYNGQLAPLPYNELTKPGMNLAALEPLNDEEQEISRNPLLDFVELDPLQGGMASDVFFEPAEGNFHIKLIFFVKIFFRHNFCIFSSKNSLKHISLL